MALRLNAEQKYIRGIFNDRLEYIIPPYQRAYSWEKEECEKLLEDLKGVFFDNPEQGYFLGNIVLAKSNEKRDIVEVIDGQQRLITLILLIKALSTLLPDNVDLKNILWINDSQGNPIAFRLKTRVFEDKDAAYLKEVIEAHPKELTINKKDNNFKQNIKYLYDNLQKFQDINDINKFADFLLGYVSLLPIESEDSEHKEARKKALVIFATINNRGRDLSDADIFKSELYSMALNTSKEKDFLHRWKKLDEKCVDIRHSIDRIFKIYSHKIRGQNGVKSSEISLKNFFDTKNKISPFNHKSYNEIMDDLDSIIQAIELFNDTRKISHNTELTKWFQLINAYTNNYPKDLLVIYLSLWHNSLQFPEKEVIKFTKSLVRYCYFQGATTTIKYYIYDLTVKIMHNTWEEFYPKEPRNYNLFGRLYKGFALLLVYLHPDQKSVPQFNIKRLRDILDYWNGEYSWFDFIGNNIPMDITKKELHDNHTKSKFHDVNYLKENINNWNDDLHEERQNILRKRLESFFMAPHEN